MTPMQAFTVLSEDLVANHTKFNILQGQMLTCLEINSSFDWFLYGQYYT